MNASPADGAERKAPIESAQLRLFVALRVPGAVQREIEKSQAELRRLLPARSASWTRAGQFHLTLRFLGDVDVMRVDELIGLLRAACASFCPLELRAQRVGFFPNAIWPRVVWVGVHDEADRLAELQRAVEWATANFSVAPAERKFSGHVTMARVKRINRRDADRLAAAAQAMTAKIFGEWGVDAVELMRSELLSDGARHTLVARLPLSGGTIAA